MAWTLEDVTCVVFRVERALQGLATLGTTIEQYDCDHPGAQLGALAAILAQQLTDVYIGLQELARSEDKETSV